MSTKVRPVPQDSSYYAPFFAQVKEEYKRARGKFGPFDNGHEGIGVIREEYLELERFVFGKDQTQEQIVNARIECIQLATMAMAFYLELL